MQNAGLIREVRGVMTRFEPLTEEIVAACTQDGLTYAELSDALSAYGLSIEKVMHDPTRKILTPAMPTMIWACMRTSFCRENSSAAPARRSFRSWPGREAFAEHWLNRIGAGST